MKYKVEKKQQSSSGDMKYSTSLFEKGLFFYDSYEPNFQEIQSINIEPSENQCRMSDFFKREFSDPEENVEKGKVIFCCENLTPHQRKQLRSSAQYFLINQCKNYFQRSHLKFFKDLEQMKDKIGVKFSQNSYSQFYFYLYMAKIKQLENNLLKYLKDFHQISIDQAFGNVRKKKNKTEHSQNFIEAVKVKFLRNLNIASVYFFSNDGFQESLKIIYETHPNDKRSLQKQMKKCRDIHEKLYQLFPYST